MKYDVQVTAIIRVDETSIALEVEEAFREVIKKYKNELVNSTIIVRESKEGR